MFLENKRAFFKKESGDFEKNVQREFEKELNKLVERRLQEDEEYKKNYRPITLLGVMKDLLQNNAFLVFSIITSLPMYLLLLIYSNPYAKYIFERLVMMIFVLFGVVFLVFTILYMSPMDPAVNILGQTATQEQIVEFNRVYGLDQPYIVRLFEAFKGLVTLDMGRSYAGNEVVMEAISRKFPVTLQVTFASLAVALILAIPSGIISAVKPYSTFDYVFMLIALLGLSIPNFWLGLVLILNFSINLHWLPATYSATDWTTLIMPAIVLGTALSASVARMTRSSMLEVINQDYITTAKAKGLSSKRVILKHALGNAMIPIVTVVGLQFGGMLGGSAVTEKVFNINGIGSYIVDKQFIPDIPVVLTGVVYVSVVISLANLVVDILYAFLDPRIKSKMKNY
ncbi:ABC transporter permease [uncultured Negativibacillus sp.]|uniref:ABC transporter permease n=1 Tax=uncultured Negativibacillus sp. TaxID=1980696 RepID=UPI0025D1BAB1|nr:ABC transporter permease [uncultured Negativibacillus sp.]